jgi:hypothetical protein
MPICHDCCSNYYLADSCSCSRWDKALRKQPAIPTDHVCCFAESCSCLRGGRKLLKKQPAVLTDYVRRFAESCRRALSWSSGS